jgi:hypothetical protein
MSDIQGHLSQRHASDETTLRDQSILPNVLLAACTGRVRPIWRVATLFTTGL